MKDDTRSLSAIWLDTILLRYVNRPFGEAEGIECRNAIREALDAERARHAALVAAARLLSNLAQPSSELPDRYIVHGNEMRALRAALDKE